MHWKAQKNLLQKALQGADARLDPAKCKEKDSRAIYRFAFLPGRCYDEGKEKEKVLPYTKEHFLWILAY